MVLQPQKHLESGTYAYLAYGSNLPSQFGESQKLVEIALERLSTKGICILQKSGHFRSSAYPPGSGPDFVNGVVAVESPLTASQLLDVCHDIERELGRTREVRWEARVLDLDLIDFGGHVLPDAATHKRWRDLDEETQKVNAPDRLLLPHPRVQDRAFVLVPLRAVAPNWRHPATGQDIGALIDALAPQDVADVQPLAGGGQD